MFLSVTRISQILSAIGARVLLALMFLSAGTLTMVQPTISETEVTVSSGDSNEGLPLFALRSSNTSVTIREASKLAEPQPPQGRLDFGAFAVERTVGKIEVVDESAGFRKIVLSDTVNQDGFTLTLGPAQGIELTTVEGISRVDASNNFSVVRYPYWSGSWKPSVSIISSHDKVTNGWIRDLAFLIGITSIGVLVFLVANSGKQSPEPRRSAVQPGPDYLVGIGSALAAFIIPSQADEGWIIARAEAAVERGYLGNLYTVGDATLPQGAILEQLYGVLFALGAEHIHLRLLFAAAALVGWLILRSVFARITAATYLTASKRNPVVWVLAAVYLLGVIGWLASIRPEGIVSVLAIAFVYCSIRLVESGDLRWFLFASLIVALGLASHQSAFIFLLPSFVVLGIASTIIWTRGPDWQSRREGFLDLLFSATVAALTLVVLSLQRMDATHMIREIGLWRTSPTHGKEWNSELSRFGMMLTHSSESFVLVAGLILNLVFALYVFRQRGNWKGRMIVLTIASAPVGLSLTASKWEWHYAALLPLSTLGWGLALAAILTVGFSRPATLQSDLRTGEIQHLAEAAPVYQRIWRAAALSCYSILLVLPLLHIDWVNRRPEWTEDAVWQHVDTILGNLIADVSKSEFLLATILAIFAVALSRRSKPAIIAGSFAGLALAAPLILVLAHSATIVQDDWSEARSRAGQIFPNPGEACGPYTHQKIVVSTQKIGPAITPSQSVPEVLNTSTRVGGQHSKAVDVTSLPPGTIVGLWVLNESGSKARGALEITDSDGVLVERVSAWSHDAPGWRLFAAEIGDSATSARFSIDGQERETFLVSDLVVMEHKPATVILKDRALFAGPFHYQFQSCAKQLVVLGSFVRGIEFMTDKTIYNLTPLENIIEVTPNAPWYSTLHAWDRRVMALQPKQP